MNKDECKCNPTEILIFPFTAGSNVDQIVNKAAKHLTALGQTEMYCLAGIGGKVSSSDGVTKAAKRIIAIDGCSVHCSRKTLKQAGFTTDLHVKVTDLGNEKESSFFMDFSEIEATIQKIRCDKSEN